MAEEIENQTSTPTPGSEKPTNSSSSSQNPNPKQLPPFYGFTAPNGEYPMVPIMYPILVPAIVPPQTGQEQTDHGAGLYMVPTFPNSFMGPIAGYPSNNLIPFTYNVPTGPSPSEAGTRGDEQVQAGQPQQGGQQAGQQRQVVVRRFQIAIHLDLMLIFKLAAVIFLFNQDGSRKRLVLLIFFASLIYLYQTGALAPFIRWLSQGVHRAGQPPQQPRPAAGNNPGPARQENENAPLLDGQVAAGGENENQPMGDDAANEGAVNANNNNNNNNNNRLWGIVKEIQLIVFGFITSLLPGFHNID